jgi:hypothetical protein
MDAWNLSKERAARYLAAWQAAVDDTPYTNRWEAQENVKQGVYGELATLEPESTFFVNILTPLASKSRDVEFVVTRVTPGREVTTIITSLIAELAVHDAVLPK